MIPVGLHNNQWRRLVGAPILALHLLGCPFPPDEHLPRDNLVALTKLQAKGQRSGHKTVLGWDLDTRRLTCELTMHKCISWKDQILSLINLKETASTDLESIVGKLNHSSFLIPPSSPLSCSIASITSQTQTKQICIFHPTSYPTRPPSLIVIPQLLPSRNLSQSHHWKTAYHYEHHRFLWKWNW